MEPLFTQEHIDYLRPKIQTTVDLLLEAMLKAGGSDYPYTLYKKAGLDMASPAPYQALVARMNKIMDEIDALEATK